MKPVWKACRLVFQAAMAALVLAGTSLPASAQQDPALQPTNTLRWVDVWGQQMLCIVTPCLPADPGDNFFWSTCPRAFDGHLPIIIPSWYVIGRRVCNEDQTGSFHCCYNGGPLPEGSWIFNALPRGSGTPGSGGGLPTGSACSEAGDCASGLCILGICSQ